MVSNDKTVLDLADVRGARLQIAPSDEERADWHSAIATIPGDDARKRALDRLQRALAKDAKPTRLSFDMRETGRVLVSVPHDPAFASAPDGRLLDEPATGADWRTRGPASYLNALSDFLVADVARRDAAVPLRIANRVRIALRGCPSNSHPMDFASASETPAAVVACRLLAASDTKSVRLDPDAAKDVKDRLATANIDCPKLLAAVATAAAAGSR